MMKMLTAIGTALFLLGTSAFAVQSDDATTYAGGQLKCVKTSTGVLQCEPVTDGSIVLTTKNLVVLRSPVDAGTASDFVKKFQDLENQDDVDTIYVYIRSPGGSIFAGDTIANVLSSSKKEVVAIVDFAASMAFHIAMHADKRVMLPTATLMQHHASGGTGYREFPNVDKQWDWIKRKVLRMNEIDADTCKNVSFEDFKKNIDRDWWLLADEAVKAGCVDSVATSVTCSKDLSKAVDLESFSFFGLRINIEWSGCPLELYPRSVQVRNVHGYTAHLDEDLSLKLDRFLLLLTDPLQHYQQYGSFRIDPTLVTPNVEAAK